MEDAQQRGPMEVLQGWDFWDKSLSATAHRPDDEDEAANKATSGVILFLKGVRRSGKSTLFNEGEKHDET